MTVVDGRGEVVVISDPEDLKAFKINLGLLGIRFFFNEFSSFLNLNL